MTKLLNKITNNIGNKAASIGCIPLHAKIRKFISRKKYVQIPKINPMTIVFAPELSLTFKLINQQAIKAIATIEIGLNNCL